MGVAIATMAIVCVLSVFNGFEDIAAQSLSRLDPELKITPSSGKVIANADSLVKVVNGVEGVEIAIPTIEEQAFAIFKNQQKPVQIKAVAPQYAQVYDIDSTIIAGAFQLCDSNVS